MPIVAAVILGACAISALVSPALLAWAVWGLWPLLLYVPYAGLVWLMNLPPGPYS